MEHKTFKQWVDSHFEYNNAENPFVNRDTKERQVKDVIIYVADKLGVVPPTVRRWYKEDYHPKFLYRQELCRIAGQSLFFKCKAKKDILTNYVKL